MSDKIKFLKEALLTLPSHTIAYTAFPNLGGCDAYEVMYPEMDLSNPQIISLLSDRVKL